MWPRPRPDIFGTTTPQAAASGARMMDTLSPTPPVLCLPTLMPGKIREIDALPGPDHGVRQEPRLLGIHAAEHDGHEQRGGLVVGHPSVHDPADEQIDFVTRQGAARRAYGR